MGKGSSPSSPLPIPPGAGPSGWKLVWSGGESGIPACGISIGRSRTSDLVLTDPEVSRRHARISPLQGSPWIIDQGSSNGIVVNGGISSRVRLDDGDRICLGSEIFRVARGDAPHPLGSAWESLLSDPLAALASISGAAAVAWEPGGDPVFEWEPGCGEPGPLRSLLLDSARDLLPRSAPDRP